MSAVMLIEVSLEAQIPKISSRGRVTHQLKRRARDLAVVIFRAFKAVPKTSKV